jgi:hypothetical protein
MVYEATDAVWQWVSTAGVIGICLLRFFTYVRRRRNPVFQHWQPGEIIAVRSLLLIITGKPVTKLTWRRLDLLLLALLMVAGLATFQDIRRHAGHHPAGAAKRVGVGH